MRAAWIASIHAIPASSPIWLCGGEMTAATASDRKRSELSSESVWEPILATGCHSGSRCPINFDHPSIAITRAYQRARNNWDFDPQGIERSSDESGMDRLDTCNPSFQLNHVRGFQLRSIAHIANSGADLQRQRELGDVDVTIDITLTMVNVTGKIIVFLHLNGSAARLTNCTS